MNVSISPLARLYGWGRQSGAPHHPDCIRVRADRGERPDHDGACALAAGHFDLGPAGARPTVGDLRARRERRATKRRRGLAVAVTLLVVGGLMLVGALGAVAGVAIAVIW